MLVTMASSISGEQLNINISGTAPFSELEDGSSAFPQTAAGLRFPEGFLAPDFSMLLYELGSDDTFCFFSRCNAFFALYLGT